MTSTSPSTVLAKLSTLAETLLEEDFPEYRAALELLQTDPEAFKKTADFEDIADSVGDLFDPEPGPELPYVALCVLLSQAERKRYCLWLDWTGEEGDGEFELWVAARVHAFGLGSLDLSFVDDWREQLD
ncbi:MAG: hypothetical protein OWQ56_06425 [Acidithiobacillus caldus]|nr:hypothetical protein [Acidithiobacillus caldus]